MSAVVVRGHRYKPWGAATEAFRYEFSRVTLSDCAPDMAADEADRRDEFVRALPDWLAVDLVTACETLAARVHELRPDTVPAVKR